jgi:hypothetical protein
MNQLETDLLAYLQKHPKIKKVSVKDIEKGIVMIVSNKHNYNKIIFEILEKMDEICLTYGIDIERTDLSISAMEFNSRIVLNIFTY